MASQPPSRGREEDRRLSLRTLAIASVASAAAALVTSRFSTIGTPVAAALTPVIVALVSEMLHRPTERIAERLTTDRPRVLPEGMGGGPPDTHPSDEPLLERAPTEPGAEAGPPAPPVRVYGRGRVGPRGRRHIAVGVVAVTGLLAFAIAAVVLTGADLATGGADRPTILGQKKDRDNDRDEPQRTVPEEQTTPETVPQDQEDPKQDTVEQTTPRTTPAPPPQTTPAPPAAPGQQQPPP